MKKQLPYFLKRILLLCTVVASLNNLMAQCSIQTTLSNTSFSNYNATVTASIPTNWDIEVTVDFGDNTVGFQYSGSQLMGNYPTGYGSHSYVRNGTYIVTTSALAYDGFDTSLFCNFVDVDTLIVTGFPCVIDASNITYTQNSNTYYFNAGFSTQDSAGWNIWEVKDSIGNTIATQNDTLTTFNYSFIQDGNYRVIFTAYALDDSVAISCWDSVSLNINVTGVQVTACNASFYMWEDSTNIGHWNIVNNSSGGDGILWYWWDFGDGNTSELAYPTHTYASPGNYTICLTTGTSISPFACSSSTCDSTFRLNQNNSVTGYISSLTVTAPVGVKEVITTLVNTNLFPNPIGETANLTFSSTINSTAKIEVVNILGSVVSTHDVYISKGSNELKLNTSALETGIYIINIISEKGVVARVKALK